MPVGTYKLTVESLLANESVVLRSEEFTLTMGDANDQFIGAALKSVSATPTNIIDSVDKPDPGREGNFRDSCADYQTALDSVTAAGAPSLNCEAGPQGRPRFYCKYSGNPGLVGAFGKCLEEEGRMGILASFCRKKASYDPSKLECQPNPH
jgi:hypothetical protein